MIDLGIDVPHAKFVEAVRKHQPEILGMSALLTTTMTAMKTVIEALEYVPTWLKFKFADTLLRTDLETQRRVAEFCQGFGVARVVRQVVQFAGVVFEVVQLVFCHCVPNVLPTSVPHHTLTVKTELVAVIDRKDVASAVNGRTFEEREQTLALETFRHRCADELTKRRSEVDSMGHERIAYIGNPPSEHYSAKRRRDGFVKAMKQLGLPITYPMPQDRNWAVHEHMQAVLDSSPPPTGAVCENDATAMVLLQKLYERNIHVPEQMSVVGNDGVVLPEFTTPRITSVEIPVMQMGQTAVQLLLEQIESHAETPPASVILQPRLVVRESTAPPGK